MIYCFTGTGNSGYAAKRIAQKTGMELVDVYDCIANGKPFETEQNETLVFVTPTHCWRIPRIVSDWMKKGALAGGHKAYFVMTCGSDIGNATEHCAGLCEELGMEYMGVGEVVMPENYVAMFPVPDTEESKQIVKAAIPVIDGFAQLISEGKALPEVRVGVVARLKSGIVNDGFYAICVKDKKFVVDDKCIACGKCAAVCVTHNIELKDGKPVWGGNCIHCMRCICDCPTGAVEYGKISVGKPRYHCPEI